MFAWNFKHKTMCNIIRCLSQDISMAVLFSCLVFAPISAGFRAQSESTDCIWKPRGLVNSTLFTHPIKEFNTDASISSFPCTSLRFSAYNRQIFSTFTERLRHCYIGCHVMQRQSHKRRWIFAEVRPNSHMLPSRTFGEHWRLPNFGPSLVGTHPLADITHTCHQLLNFTAYCRGVSTVSSSTVSSAYQCTSSPCRRAIAMMSAQ